MNWSSHPQAGAAQNFVWICVLNVRRWMLPPPSTFRSFSLYISPARPLPKIPFFGYLCPPGWTAVVSMIVTCSELVAILLMKKDRSFDHRETSHFSVLSSLLPVMFLVPILTIPLSSLYCFVSCILSLLPHPTVSFFAIGHWSAFQGLSCKTQLTPVFSQ